MGVSCTHARLCRLIIIPTSLPRSPTLLLLHRCLHPTFPPYVTIVWCWHHNLGISSPQGVIVVILMPYLVAQPSLHGLAAYCVCISVRPTHLLSIHHVSKEQTANILEPGCCGHRVGYLPTYLLPRSIGDPAMIGRELRVKAWEGGCRTYPTRVPRIFERIVPFFL